MKLFDDLNSIRLLYKYMKFDIFEKIVRGSITYGKSITIIIIDKCTLNCNFCRGGIDDDIINLRTSNKIMDFTTFKTIVDKCAEFGICKFDLSPPIGEPFMDRGIFDKLDYLEKNKSVSDVLITTNLTLLSEDDLNKLSKYKKLTIHISVYGCCSDSYKEQTGRDLFSKFKKNLNILYEFCESNPSNFKIRFNIRCSLDYESEIFLALVKFYSKFGFLLRANEVSNVNRAGNIATKTDRGINSKCGICPYGPGSGGGIDQYGNLLFCPFNDIKKVGIVGNILDLSISDIYDGEKWKTVIENHKNNRYVGICSTCDENF